MSRVSILNAASLATMLVLSLAAADAASKEPASGSKSIGEVSIIGNTELPNIEFDLPWRLPSVAKRDEQKPITRLDGMLGSIEPHRHRQKVFFSQHLKLDVPKY